jgi:hypothetical protein
MIMSKIEKSIFISYRRKDISWALAVYQYLSNQMYDVFFDYTSIPSGDFEQIIISNIKARAHFVLILTPTALDRCDESGDWLRREIETAMDEKRNIVPLFFDGFNFGSSTVAEKLTGKLYTIRRYNGLDIPSGYFVEAMERLNKRYLNIPLDAVLHPIPRKVQKIVKKQQAAADQDASRLGADLLYMEEAVNYVKKVEDVKAGIKSEKLTSGRNSLVKEFGDTHASLVEEASSDLVQQELEAMYSTFSESAQPGTRGMLVFFPTTALSLRTKPILSPDTIIRRIPVNEQLICAEPEDQAINKVGKNEKWLKVRDSSNKEGYVAAWSVRYAHISESAATMIEPASSNRIEHSSLYTVLAQIAQEFAHIKIDRNISKEDLNLILSRFPKTGEIKG